MGWRFAGGILFLVIPILVVGVILGLVIGGNQELLASRDLRRLLFCLIPFLVPVIGMIVGSLGMRKWVNPLADVMSAAESLAEGDFSVRVVEKGDQEFLKLAKSFNNMAGELEHAEIQRRNMTADVAHELRTPLHILQGNLEGALDGVYEASRIISAPCWKKPACCSAWWKICRPCRWRNPAPWISIFKNFLWLNCWRMWSPASAAGQKRAGLVY